MVIVASKKAASRHSVSRGEFLLLLSVAILLLFNLVLFQKLLIAQPTPPSASSGYAPAAGDYSFWLVAGGVLVSITLVATVLFLKYRDNGDWIEESFF